MRYDIIFLGGGPAGYEGAIHAGKKGLKTAVIEMYKPGGTCLQWGCIPTKTLLHTVKTIKMVKNAKKSGLNFGELSFDLDKINKQKDRVVSKLTKGIELLFKENGVDLIVGRGKVIAKDTVLVNGNDKIEGDRIVIAAGSLPADLPFLKPDGDRVINSNRALELANIPEKLLVVGAGAIGVEMAVIYQYLGSTVTVVELMDQIIPGSDAEVSDILKKELGKQKIKIHTSTTVSDPQKSDDGQSMTVSLKNDKKEWEESFSSILLAVGRKPNSQEIFDDSLNIRTDKRGFIEVDDNLKTGEDTIFACGDIIGDPQLAHKASHQAIAIVDYIRNGDPVHHHPVPGAVFTFPEFASIGLTEEQAKAEQIEYKVGRFPYSAGSRSNAIDEKAGLVKVLAATDNTVIGAHIVGAEAGDLLPILTLAVQKKMKADAFKELICIHPTLSENLWDALGEIAGFSIHI